IALTRSAWRIVVPPLRSLGAAKFYSSESNYSEFPICISNTRIVRFSGPRHSELSREQAQTGTFWRPSPEKRRSRQLGIRQFPHSDKTYQDLAPAKHVLT